MQYRQRNRCQYGKCRAYVHPGHFLCLNHFHDYQDGLIDQCAKCGRFKDSYYELCIECYTGTRDHRLLQAMPKQRYDIEHSAAWEKRDKQADKFYVYILKVERAEFYIGQTRDLRERLSEHKDGTVASTAGRKVALKYFEVLSSREVAERREAELKQIRDSNPREIRHMIISFQDLIRCVDPN